MGTVAILATDRVVEISALLGAAAIGKVIEEVVVCPFFLRNIFFTTAATDHIDHNSTTTTATTSFHGTSLLPGYSMESLEVLKVGYNMDIMRQSACLVVNQITV